MNSNLSARRQAKLLAKLREAINARHAAEGALGDQFLAAKHDADVLLARSRRDANETYREKREQLQEVYEAERAKLTGEYERERTEAQSQYRAIRSEAESTKTEATQQAEREQKDAAWQSLTIYEAAKSRNEERLERGRNWLAQRSAEIEAIANDAESILAARSLESESPIKNQKPEQHGALKPTEATSEACKTAQQELIKAIEHARKDGVQFYSQKLPDLLAGPLPAGIFIGLLSVLLPILGLTIGWQNVTTYAVSLLIPSISAAISYLLLSPRSRENSIKGYQQTSNSILQSKNLLTKVKRLTQLLCEREMQEAKQRRDKELEEIGIRVEQLASDAETKSSQLMQEAGQKFPTLLAELRDDQKAQVKAIDQKHEANLAEVANRRDTELATAEDVYSRTIGRAEDQRDEAWQRMFEDWLVRYDDIRAELRDMRAECDRLFPDFAETEYSSWAKPSETTQAISFGKLTYDLRKVENGLSQDSRLTPPETKLELPALMTLSETPTMLITASGQGRAAGVELLQAMMLRMITAMPPGKVRFTILDPIGLGDNFQSYMHLADSDEKLIASRIWSESRDIEEQLSRLTNHMEVVIQKYLRSEYESIHEYNAQAGEVAEPFQVVVISDFPGNFSEASAKRLQSLVTGGPRCGIYTLIGCDLKLRMPTDFQLDELKESAVWLDWDASSNQFVWQNETFESLPLNLAEPPPADVMVETLRQVGEDAKNAVKVEVPFSVVEPKPEDIWTQTCGSELLIPIGRAGANRLQYVRLGKGTSQHLLVAGKTGSGKSTFLHALVTSAAMHFSPDEVQFYLVDFKKGVEFKSYATHRLPHAKVIAIESEREFGLSVLERLDEELRVRGENFRAAGVQNLEDYREARPKEKVPRVLLIVDEFQELFVEDDRLAQESSLLLDRLVRQGRAFGIHVLLGTQTLAGAYSIARSTLGQMAIRVALECSESDAHLILSDERNTAARFLSRPGEAIYNAQNGLVTANEPFQVVWLPDRDRASRLDALDEHRHKLELPKPESIVFEGNSPADPLANGFLVDLIENQIDDRPAGLPPRAWLGDAVAIKPPTHTELGRHPGANMLVVGADEASALGILTTAIISLLSAEKGELYVLDGSRPGETGHGVWPKVVNALKSKSSPDHLHYADQTGVTETLATLAGEVARRETEGATDPDHSIYLVLHNGARLRELRRREDDFSFGSSSEPKRPDQQLTEILKNGPAVGVHTLIWSDSYNSVNRLFDRQTMREFAQRVALQMSAADSSNLIDSPSASDLSVHRGLFYNDETGQTEKFRPYGPPEDEWLELVKK